MSSPGSGRCAAAAAVVVEYRRSAQVARANGQLWQFIVYCDRTTAAAAATADWRRLSRPRLELELDVKLRPVVASSYLQMPRPIGANHDAAHASAVKHINFSRVDVGRPAR